jgi:hypothetical protein
MIAGRRRVQAGEAALQAQVKNLFDRKEAHSAQ